MCRKFVGNGCRESARVERAWNVASGSWQEVPDESTASCMVQHLRRMRTHSLHIDICQYAKMLAHYARDDDAEKML